MVTRILVPVALLLMAANTYALDSDEDGGVRLFAWPSRGGYLGVGVAEIDAERAKALSLKEVRGVEITRVEPGGPADKAGLKAADVVLEYNGSRVEGTEQFIRLVRETPSGRSVRLLVSRAGKIETVEAVTANRRTSMRRGENAFGFTLPEWNMPELALPDVPRPYVGWRNARLGIEGESLEGQLAKYFGVSEGVLVRSVVTDSPADRAGIRAGDVVTHVGKERVTSTREITAALREARTGNRMTLEVAVVRDRKPLTLAITLEPERDDRGGRHRSGRTQRL